MNKLCRGVSGRENLLCCGFFFSLIRNVFKIAKQITIEMSGTNYKMSLKCAGYNIQVSLFCS